jgi:hypothetical protein
MIFVHARRPGRHPSDAATSCMVAMRWTAQARVLSMPSRSPMARLVRTASPIELSRIASRSVSRRVAVVAVSSSMIGR